MQFPTKSFGKHEKKAVVVPAVVHKATAFRSSAPTVHCLRMCLCVFAVMNRSGIIFYDVLRCEREWWRFIYINLFDCDAIFTPQFSLCRMLRSLMKLWSVMKLIVNFSVAKTREKFTWTGWWWYLYVGPLPLPFKSFYDAKVSYGENNSIMLPAIVYEGREGKIETCTGIRNGLKLWTGWHF